MANYKIGTRGSLLAFTQSTQIKERLENLSDDSFELIKIETTGDQNQEIPLWQMEGQNFFTRELDLALIEKSVDFVIHSYKDLGSVRPNEIEIAAITKRSFSEDILLLKKETVKKIQTGSLGRELIVGTSSPRRIFNIENSLIDFLPLKEKTSIKTKTLRGNVNTRISKLQKNKYDAIVLALAGIERLANSKESKKELESLLKGITFMVLPKSFFPGAASQGALAIEILRERDDSNKLLTVLKQLTDKNTEKEIQRERKAFNSYGGGCHLAVGISCSNTLAGIVHIHRGTNENSPVDRSFLETKRPELSTKKQIFIGLPETKKLSYDNDNRVIYDKLISKKTINPQEKKIEGNFFVTSSYPINYLKSVYTKEAIFSSGAKTFKRLAKELFFVNGSADSLGEEQIKRLISSKALNIMENLRDFQVLTNESAKSALGKAVATYSREILHTDPSFDKTILETEIFYWTSFFQYQNYVKKYPEIKDKIHCSGLGKTYNQFKELKIGVLPFYSVKEFYKYISF